MTDEQKTQAWVAAEKEYNESPEGSEWILRWKVAHPDIAKKD
jgi:hypothetical protein